jgi:hypothetical protein
MFKNAKDVENFSDEQLVALVREQSYNVGSEDLLAPEIFQKYKEASAIVNSTESEIEAISFAIRDRVQDIFDEGDEEDEIDEFMNGAAGIIGQYYNGEYEHRPDGFWIPSTC